MKPPGFLIAHRGASAHAPENTLEALSRAADAGVGWAEIDVQVTADGVPVLMHDHEVDRTTDGTGLVAGLTSAEIARLRCQGPDGKSGAVRVPTLDDALTLAAERGLGLVVEIKATWGVDGEDAAAVAARLSKPVPDGLLVTSFSVPALQTMRTLRRNVPLGLACIRVPRNPSGVGAALDLSAIHCNERLVTLADVQAVRAAGLSLAVATVNDADRARTLLAMGVPAVMTDDPYLLEARRTIPKPDAVL